MPDAATDTASPPRGARVALLRCPILRDGGESIHGKR